MDLQREFPGLARSTYLNSCAHGLLPRRTRAAIEAHLDIWTDLPDWDVWNEGILASRQAFARLVNAPLECVANHANASGAIGSVMSAIPKGRIVTLDIDFPTAPFLAQRQTARGLGHVHVQRAGFIRAEEWRKHIRGAALACIPAVASFTGYRLDVSEFARVAREEGVPLLVDAFQAAGTYPIDVEAWDVDFLVTGTYKWLMGPVGTAFLYARKDRHAWVPTTSGWYAAREPYAFDPLDDLAPDARRFQHGGANVLGCVAYAQSARLLEEVGVGNVERRNGALVDRVISHARDRKYEVLTPEDARDRASIVTFRVPDLQKALATCANEGVIVNSRLGGIRVSPHFYNTERDVDRLFAVLDALG